MYIHYIQGFFHSKARYYSAQVRVRVRVTLRLTISQSVCLGIKPSLGQLTRVCFLLDISFRQLQVCNFVAPSLTRGRVCKFLDSPPYVFMESWAVRNRILPLGIIFRPEDGSRMFFLRSDKPQLPQRTERTYLPIQPWRHTNPRLQWEIQGTRGASSQWIVGVRLQSL
jgi:hypothetical protein